MELQKFNHQNTITSMEVAEMIERQHNELLKTIRQYINYLAEGEIPHGDFFIESTYTDANHQERPCYDITKKGCDMIANKLTGAKGTIFTALYVKRFEDMEQTLINGISPELQAIIMQDKKLVQHDERIKALEETKYISPLQKKKLTKMINELVVKACGGKDTQAYKKISKKLYSSLNHKVFEKFSISQRAEIPFVKYDEAAEFISNWYPDFDQKIEIKKLNEESS
jgi:Rha family phage regulatory protein